MAMTTTDKMMPSPALIMTMMMSDEDLMMKQVEATHAPDDREFEVELLLNLVEDILDRATLNVDTDIAPVVIE